MLSIIQRIRQKLFYIPFLTCACLGMAFTNHVMAQPRQIIVDQIIAVVNGHVITQGELNERIIQVEKKLKASGGTVPSKTELQKQLLEHMILENVQLQMAKEVGIRVDDTQLDRTIANIAAQNKISVNELQKRIEKDDLSYASYRENVRMEIVIDRLREREVINKVQVSESEVDNILDSADSATPSHTEVRLGHILIRIPENASAEQIASRRTRAEQVLRNLRSGGNFQQNAATFSDADDGLSGGDMGWRAYERLPQLFIQGIQNLKPGEISEILKSSNGFHILKVLEHRSTTSSSMQKGTKHIPVEQIHARHILIKVNNLVSAEEARRKLLDLKQRLANNTDTFENLAKMYSNDLSARKGGDLGWIYPGDTVPEFEQVLVALKPGQISEPVETQFGFHLIQAIARKTDDMSVERKRIAIKNALRERKIEEATEEWLRQVRDRAYVEYRMEDKPSP